ncbi:MAG: YihY/virulence factor BrkB family protein [Candidatus Cloacimonetes bacterium]|nr:YihY/virulence factor BrkB family protein [Candidatus Cloacimonadota bacterium]
MSKDTFLSPLIKLKNDFQNICKRFALDKCFVRASAMGYITFLGFIPFVMVILIFTPDITMVKIKETIIAFIFKTFMPNSAQTMKDVFVELMDRRVGMDVISFVLLVVTSFLLFKSISNTFDVIMKTHHLKRHSLGREFERFVTALIGGLVIVAALLFSTSLPLINQITKITFIIQILPYFFIFLVLFALYLYAPSSRPKVWSALLGAILSSVVWILLKLCFDWYIATFTNVRSVYGTLGAFPIFMIWLYFNWVTILFGMEVVSYFSGVKHPKIQKDKKSKKINLKISLEKEIDEESVKKFKEMELPRTNKSKKDFLELIKFILNNNNEK